MPGYEPLDRKHVLSHAHSLFPRATIKLIYAPDETIYIDVDGDASLSAAVFYRRNQSRMSL